LCINPKEAEDLALAADVLAMIPEFLTKPNVLGIGEIGLNRNTRNELKVFEQHVELAVKYNQLILVHTPHLEDKLKGTRLIVDLLRSHPGVKPERVIIDHVEEHTVNLVLDRGFWAGITLYPDSKSSPPRAVDMLETSGHDRIWLNSACDWGVSDPLAVPKAAFEMRRRGHTAAYVDHVLYQNPVRFLSQCPKFRLGA
jgi:predicted metal-dependent TIM-barrel fold hydrolase